MNSIRDVNLLIEVKYKERRILYTVTLADLNMWVDCKTYRVQTEAGFESYCTHLLPSSVGT